MNTVLDYTIQESELHRGFAEEIKINVLQPLNVMLVNLREEKNNWLAGIETIKKNLNLLQEKQQLEEVLIRSTKLWIQEMQEKKKKLIHSHERSSKTEEEKVPESITSLGKLIEAKTRKIEAIKGNWEALMESVEKEKEKMKAVINKIQDTEYSRILTIRQILIISNNIYLKGINRLAMLCGNVMKSYSRVDAKQDVQDFISRHSFCSASERELAELYKTSNHDPHTNNSVEVRVAAVESDKEVENIKKDALALRSYHTRVSRQEAKLYLNASCIKNLNADLACEEPANIALLLYAAHRFASKLGRNSVYKNGRMRSRDAIENGAEESESIFEALIPKYWNFSEEQINCVDQILNSVEQIDKFSLGSSSFHSLFVQLLKHWAQTLASQNGKTEISKQFYKGVYSIAWGYIHWQIHKRVKYRDEDFEAELQGTIRAREFSSYNASDNLITNAQFADYTISILESLQEKKYSNKIAIPLALWLFKVHVAPALLGDDVLISEKLIVDSKPLCTMLGIEMGWEYMLFLRCIMDLFILGEDFTAKSEKQAKGFKAVILLKKLIETNCLDLIANIKNSAQKIMPIVYEKHESASMLLNVVEALEISLSDFKHNFGSCFNKIKLVIDLVQLLYIPWYYSQVTYSGDQTYESALKRILEVNGEKVLSSLPEVHRSFAGTSSEGEFAGTLKMIAVFKEEVEKFTEVYSCIWNKHIQAPEYFYSKAMREVLYKSLQTASLAGDNEFFAEMAIALNGLDNQCSVPQPEHTANVLLPPVQGWFRQKYVLCYK